MLPEKTTFVLPAVEPDPAPLSLPCKIGRLRTKTSLPVSETMEPFGNTFRRSWQTVPFRGALHA